MSTLLFMSYLLSIVGSTILMLFVYQKRNTSATIQAFVFFTFFTVCWQVAAFASEITVDSPRTSQLSTNLGVAAGTFMALYFYIFCKSFSINNRKISYFDRSLLLISILFSALAAMSKIITLNDNSELVYSALYTINTVFIISLFLMGTAYLLKKYAKDKSSRTQIKYLFAGIAIALIINLLTGYILLDSPKLYYFSWLSPLSILLMVALFLLAILRHRLFNIRPIVARTVSYILLSSFVALIYVGLAFIVKKIIAPDTQITAWQYIPNIILTTILVLLFPLVKGSFDKVTNRIFFRDSYDPQVFLGQLNKNLVNVVEINKLLRHSAEIIEVNLKVEFCSFYLLSTQYVSQRYIGSAKSKLSEEDIELINKHFKTKSHKVLMTDELSDQTDKAELYKLLTENQIGMVIRLSGNSVAKDYRGLGYLVLGYKKSGNLFSEQDIKIMDIITNEISIAAENALRFEEIEQFSITLQKRIEEATKELRKSNEKLKALDEAKDEFISMASHQLRTPLTSVKGYLSMLAEGDAGKLNEAQRKFIDQAFISSQRMVYLIADLLNVSRLKTGKFVIEASSIYLPDVIESEIAQLNETVKSRGLTMSFDKPKEFPMLHLDETKIRQVIMNFTDNAIYYTKAGGSINISLKLVDEVAEFTVSDDGIGVPKAEQPHLFTKFYRAGNARKARPDGTGLGLFMAKKVVVAQGGAIIFNSTEGKGSTFGFRFNVPNLNVPDQAK